MVRWIYDYDIQSSKKEAWFFSSLRVVFTHTYFVHLSEKPMTIQNWDRILKRLDPKITSCLFRYFGIEKFLQLGYSPTDARAFNKVALRYGRKRYPKLD